MKRGLISSFAKNHPEFVYVDDLGNRYAVAVGSPLRSFLEEKGDFDEDEDLFWIKLDVNVDDFPRTGETFFLSPLLDARRRSSAVEARRYPERIKRKDRSAFVVLGVKYGKLRRRKEEEEEEEDS